MDGAQAYSNGALFEDPQFDHILPSLRDVTGLAASKINVVVVGRVALRAYGLDQDIGSTIQVAVKDAHMKRAKRYLLASGYAQTDERKRLSSKHAGAHPASSSDSSLQSDGSCRLTRHSCNGPLTISLSYATVWNLSLGTEYRRSVQLLPQMDVPFPRFPVYLKAILRTAAGLYRGEAAVTAFDAAPNIIATAKAMIATSPPEILASLKSADRFMAKYLPCPNKTRDWESYVCAQAIRIYLGEITEHEAEQRMPRLRPAPRLADIGNHSSKPHAGWRKPWAVGGDARDCSGSPAITILIEPRSSVSSRHRLAYRLRQVLDKLGKERQLHVATADMSSVA
ncbi:hypothetical protein KEM52_004843 [Ascosphaera acerosa]|nr:hypothetical protein KEM52_004843 [Ascosphaera acerosa]